MTEPNVEPQHLELIHASAITESVAAARGYWTATTKTEVKRLGFTDTQANAPSLVLPVHDVYGETPFYQIRPDKPRVSLGKVLKYETPRDARMAVDVPPICRQNLGNPDVPLFITEGIRKADAAASFGVCVVDLIGVWNWRGTNDQGGKTLLADFEHIALNGRVVYVVFDSDAMTKREVHAACVRLAEVMKARGADVRFVILPARSDGAKTGLDDFLADGQTIDDAIQLARRELPEVQGEVSKTYFEQNGGLYWRKQTRDGAVDTALTNFTARIISDILEDDGAEVTRAFEIEATLGKRSTRFQIPAQKYAGFNWPVEHLGASAIVYPGLGVRDHARTAIQILSGDVPSRHIYSHTGWREIEGVRCYLHGGGGIGPAGPVDGMAVALPGGMDNFWLPAPSSGDNLRRAVRASLSVVGVAPGQITYPLIAATYAAAVAPIPESLHVAGPTGAGKTEVTALMQQHFGADMNASKLPGSWESTANALESLTFAASHALFVIDDFAPNGRGADAHRFQRDADRLLRAKANGAGRQRMRADTSLHPVKPPRAMILSTGEDVPRGQSLRARLVILELGPGEVNWKRLTICQQEATDGLYAAAMAGFIQWLAARYPETAGTPALLNRGQVGQVGQVALVEESPHKRTPRAMAGLATGMRLFLDFATDIGALTAEESARHWNAAVEALGSVALKQTSFQNASEPTRQFADLLSSALASGRAHVAGGDGDEPHHPGAWGWRLNTIGTGDYQRGEWRPQGERIGWIVGDDLYLDRDASLAMARRFVGDGSEPFTITRDTLGMRLKERGHLVTTETARGGTSVRRTLQGQRRDVWHVHAHFASSPLSVPDQSDQLKPNANENGHSWSGWSETDVTPDHEEPDTDAENGTTAQVGQVSGVGECDSVNGEGDEGSQVGNPETRDQEPRNPDHTSEEGKYCRICGEPPIQRLSRSGLCYRCVVEFAR